VEICAGSAVWRHAGMLIESSEIQQDIEQDLQQRSTSEQRKQEHRSNEEKDYHYQPPD
jgi:hypothetical protein